MNARALAGAAAACFACTAPPAGAQGEYALLIFGDSGTGRARQRQVAEAMSQACAERGCGVQAYFAGHDHHQEHISTAGFEQFVQGAAAKLRRVRDVTYSAELPMRQRFARSVPGFAIATLTERTMDVRFFDGTDARAREIYHCRATLEASACVPQPGLP